MNRGQQVAVFGGTREGRELSRFLADRGAEVTLFVATQYGEELISPTDGLAVCAGRLTTEEMGERLGAISPAVVVDATHPYAQEVTRNIRTACESTGLPYLRLIREEWRSGGARTAATAAEAAHMLRHIPGKILLTVGSKELEAFAAEEELVGRLIARVLPSPEVLAKCVALGFKGPNLICMQGPFSHAMNVATIRDLGITCLVTKDSGITGGFYQKLSATEETGISLLVIRRPVAETGHSLAEMQSLLEHQLALPAVPAAPAQSTPRFPLFVKLADRPVLVVGGGRIATRRVAVLRQFGGRVTVISPQLTPELAELATSGHLLWRQEEYSGIPEQYTLAVAATNNRAVNRQVGLDARQLHIPVSVCDRREECTFWFPATIQGGNLVAGIVSTDGDHAAVKHITRRIRSIWEEEHT